MIVVNYIEGAKRRHRSKTQTATEVFFAKPEKKMTIHKSMSETGH